MPTANYDSQPLSSTVIQRRTLFTTNAWVSSLLLFVTCFFYAVKRDDSKWIARVPYSSYLTVTSNPDIPNIKDHLNFLTTPPFTTRLPDPYKALFAREMACDTLPDLQIISPRCNCLFGAYFSVLDFPTLDAGNIESRYAEFEDKVRKGATREYNCFAERTATIIEAYTDVERTVVFDVILWWWATVTASHICTSFWLSRNELPQRIGLALLLFAVTAVFLWVFWSADYSRYWYILGYFGVPLVVWSTLSTVSVITKLARGDRKKVEGEAKMKNKSYVSRIRGFFLWNDVLDSDGFMLLPLTVGFVCSHRTMLLMLRRNDIEEVCIITYICAFAAACSFIVRVLQNSKNDFLGKTTTGLEARKEIILEQISFASLWTWGITLVALVYLQGMFSSLGGLPNFHTFTMYARGSVFVFVIMVVMQVPLRHAMLPYTHPQQVAIFHVLEFLSRGSAMVILWNSIIL